jgi:hypothetical protein
MKRFVTAKAMMSLEVTLRTQVFAFLMKRFVTAKAMMSLEVTLNA